MCRFFLNAGLPYIEGPTDHPDLFKPSRDSPEPQGNQHLESNMLNKSPQLFWSPVYTESELATVLHMKSESEVNSDGVQAPEGKKQQQKN